MEPAEPMTTGTDQEVSRRAVLVILAVAALAVAAFLANRAVENGIRLEAGSFGRTPVHFGTQRDGDVISFVPYRHGEEFFYQFSIRNAGRKVRITGVPLTTDFGFYDETEVRLQPDGGRVGDIAASVPFEPFTLKHGEEVGLFVKARFAHCGERGLPIGTRLTTSGHAVRVRSWWATETVSVPYRLPIPIMKGLNDELLPQAVLPAECRAPSG